MSSSSACTVKVPYGKVSMQKQWGIYYGRLQRFLSRDYYPEVGLIGQLVSRHWTDGIELSIWSPPIQGKRATFSEAQSAQYTPAKVGDEFGPAWSTHWFRVCVESSSSKEEDGIYIHWKSDAEGLVWTMDGQPVHGLSAQDRFDFPLSLVQSANQNAPTIFFIEMACTGLFGNGSGGGMINPPDPKRNYKVQACEFREYKTNALSLYYDMQILQDMASTFGEGDPRGKRALYTANKIINLFNRPDLGSVGETIEKCLEVSKSFLRPEQMPPSAPLIVTAVGNCHIDTAWLWRYDETRRKTARSWSSQLALMNRHPNYIFVASQMQQLEWLRLDYPDLFTRIQMKAQTGHFIPIGGSWVEMDGNLPSGESFARQFLYGQKFLIEHFGHPSEVFWLPGNFVKWETNSHM